MASTPTPHDEQCAPHSTHLCAFPCKVVCLPDGQSDCYLCKRPGFYYLYQYRFHHYCAECLRTKLGFEQCCGYDWDEEDEYLIRCQRFVLKQKLSKIQAIRTYWLKTYKQ